MHYVYLIESVHNRSQHYVGQTRDLKARIFMRGRIEVWNAPLAYCLTRAHPRPKDFLTGRTRSSAPAARPDLQRAGNPP
jgi:hypothetical protein